MIYIFSDDGRIKASWLHFYAYSHIPVVKYLSQDVKSAALRLQVQVWILSSGLKVANRASSEILRVLWL
jgi:hypothetical protein